MSKTEESACLHRHVFDHGYGTYTCWDCGVQGDWMPRKRRIKWRDEKRKRKAAGQPKEGADDVAS